MITATLLNYQLVIFHIKHGTKNILNICKFSNRTFFVELRDDQVKIKVVFTEEVGNCRRILKNNFEILGQLIG